ncbi:MAG: hypothetical protein ACREJO_16310 [Phycisphaerales bacterium]
MIYSEGVSGDLPNDPSMPTPRILSVGMHTISGSVGSGDTQDWINLTIPAGMQLVWIILESYDSSDARAFLGVQAGDFFVGGDQTASSYLGYTHFGPSVLGADLLARMGDPNAAFGSQGFDPPLNPGSYTFLIQQFGDETNFQFTLNVIAVPGPATAVLAACSAAACLRRRRALENV